MSTPPDELTIVLDAAWTPTMPVRPDPIPLRAAFGRVVERHNLFEESLKRLDEWAASNDLNGRLLVEGVTYWPRLREPMWHWLHERLLWCYAVDDLLGGLVPDHFTVPADEFALIDVLRARGGRLVIEGDVDAVVGPVTVTPEPSPTGRVRRWVRRRLPGLDNVERRSPTDELQRHLETLGRRIEQISAGSGRRILVLTFPSGFQQVGRDQSGGRRDPNLFTVIERLRTVELEPIIYGNGMASSNIDDRAAADLDEHLVPAYIARSRWGRPEDGARVQRAVDAADAAIDGSGAIPVDVDGVDLAPALAAALRETAARVIHADVHQLARAERMLDEVRPRAIVMTHEGQRTPWLMAAAGHRVPTFALQHGVLYPTHPGYSGDQDPKRPLPSTTFVFGEYERRVLLHGGYPADAVDVSGSPRLDLDSKVTIETAATDRDEIRGELGVAPSARLLVVSTMHLPFVQRSHFAHMLERVFGGPLPEIHLVFKQHPGERDDGPYRRLLIGMAQAGGYAPPAISVIRDIDLYRLLRAADAHLGLHSTVLTDAVVAGTPNLIAIVEAHSDLLGYVNAGVARPIHDVNELGDALRDPRPPDPDARRAFLDDHFRHGDASEYIARTIVSAVGDTRIDAAGIV